MKKFILIAMLAFFTIGAFASESEKVKTDTENKEFFEIVDVQDSYYHLSNVKYNSIYNIHSNLKQNTINTLNNYSVNLRCSVNCKTTINKSNQLIKKHLRKSTFNDFLNRFIYYNNHRCYSSLN